MNELMVQGGITLPAFTTKQSEDLTGIKATNFFGYLQLLQKQTREEVFESVPGSKPGDLVYKKGGQDKSPINLGNSFNAAIFGVRAKATCYEDGMISAEYAIPNGTDEADKTEKYDKYLEEAKKDTGINKKWRAGLELLLWVPDLNEFATYFANTPTIVSEVEQTVAPFVGHTVRLYSFTKPNSKGTWHKVTCEEVASDDWENVPTNEQIQDALQLFTNPSKPNIDGAEKVEDTDAPKRQR